MVSPKEEEEARSRAFQSEGFKKKCRGYFVSAFPAVMVQTMEVERVIPELRSLAKELKLDPYEWNILDGLCKDERPLNEETKDPLAALDYIRKKQLPERALVMFKDFHHHLPGVEVIEAVRQLVELCKATNRYMVFLSPVSEVPRELEKLIVVVEHDLPTKEDLEMILREDLPYAKKYVNAMDKDALSKVLDAAKGLTAFEAENAFALSCGIKKALDVDVIHQQKRQILAKSQVLEYYDVPHTLNDVGGLDNLKQWLVERELAFSEKAKKYGLPAPKGILTIGIPGTGKSLTAKAAASAWGIPLLRFDVGKVFAGLVGASEANMRSALKVAEAMAPCILWLDEIEKAFAGLGSSGSTDSGVTARVFGNFLTWMQEQKSGVFIYATANNARLLPPEMLRKGRFDELFFVDLPNEEERLAIWTIHIVKKGRDPKKFDIVDLVKRSLDFTGAEIEAALNAAMFRAFAKDKEVTDLHIAKALMDTVPISRQMSEQLNESRNWAMHRAVPATTREADAKIHGRKSLD
jgi:SpoVK/Ycf46/Vps4 family AAA+-type ATPase